MSNFVIDVQNVSDSHDDFPIKNKKIRQWLVEFNQKRGMEWYKLSDFTAEIKALIRCMFKKVDVIHYVDGEHSTQFVPKLLKSIHFRRPKIVATFHQPPEILDSLIIKEAIPDLDVITVVSPEQESYFKKFVSEDRVRFIMHGINTDFFKPINTRSKNIKFRCVTVGHWQRDFVTIRDVIQRLQGYKNIEFHVVASSLSGPKQTGLEDLTTVTIYRDNIDDERLLKLYQESDILFLPLLKSTANNTLLEAIACGLPILSTLLPSIETYLPGKEAILIKDNDPQRFAETILHIASNPKERNMMAQEARKRAEELDWRRITPQYEAIYSELINKN